MPEIPPFTAENYPQSYAVKQHILAQEVPLRGLIRDMGDLLGIGRGLLTTPESGAYSKEETGRGLCVLMCSIAEDGLPKKFRKLVVGTTVARVTPWNEDQIGSSRFTHTWSHCQFKEERVIFFVDMVPRQIDPRLDAIAIDEMSRESLYYPDLENSGWLPKISIDDRLENYCNKYFQINGVALDMRKQRRLRSLAFNTRDLLAC